MWSDAGRRPAGHRRAVAYSTMWTVPEQPGRADRPAPTPAAAAVVMLLTLGWVVGLGVVVWFGFRIGMRSWAAMGTGNVTGVNRADRDSAVLLIWLAAVLVGSPLVIAVAAYLGRLRRTALVYLVLAVGLAVPAVPIGAHARRTLHPQPAQPSRAPVCQEHSGGDNRCPGG